MPPGFDFASLLDRRGGSRYNLCANPRGCRQVVRHQPSKLTSRVRIPSPALGGPVAQGQSTRLITAWLQVRILPGPLNKMDDFEFSAHARDILEERAILEDWVWSTIELPETVENREDGTTHYIKSIEEFGGRLMRVVVNSQTQPKRIVTVFFDRRLRSTK